MRLFGLTLLLLSFLLTVIRQPAPNSPWIAFTSLTGGQGSIFLMDFYGRQVHQISPSTTDDYSPSWSDSGHKVVFASRSDGRESIYQYDLRTQRIEPVASEPNRLRANYSPDGDWILLVDFNDENWDIYRVQPQSAARQRLTHHPAQDGFPSWSSDGQWIAFASERSGLWQIYRMRSDGSQLEQLSNTLEESWQPAWSPTIDLRWNPSMLLSIGLIMFILGMMIKTN